MELETVITIVVGIASLLTALTVIVKFPVTKWLWRRLVSGPITEWAHQTADAAIKPYAEQNRVDHAEVTHRIDGMECKIDGLQTDVTELKKSQEQIEEEITSPI